MIEISGKIRKLNDASNKTKAFVDIKLDNGVVIKSLRVIEGKKGLFVSMPQTLGKDGKWYDAVFPTTSELRNSINSTVLNALK